jgi:hypothetical protein
MQSLVNQRVQFPKLQLHVVTGQTVVEIVAKIVIATAVVHVVEYVVLVPNSLLVNRHEVVDLSKPRADPDVTTRMLVKPRADPDVTTGMLDKLQADPDVIIGVLAKPDLRRGLIPSLRLQQPIRSLENLTAPNRKKPRRATHLKKVMPSELRR